MPFQEGSGWEGPTGRSRRTIVLIGVSNQKEFFMKKTFRIFMAFFVLGLMILSAQPVDNLDTLAGVKTKAEIDALVSALCRGELTGAQPLFEREGGPYRVYTSYINNRKGAADIHMLDHEIFLVMSGTAEVTLGGDVTDKTAKSENEFRGTTIVGGETRTVSAGDIISIPCGTPHQMNPGTGHILYIVIKIAGAR